MLQVASREDDHVVPGLLKEIAPSRVVPSLVLGQVHDPVVLGDDTLFSPEQVDGSEPLPVDDHIRVALRPRYTSRDESESCERLTRRHGMPVKQRQSLTRAYDATPPLCPLAEGLELERRRETATQDGITHGDQMRDRYLGCAVEPGARGRCHACATQVRDVLIRQFQSPPAHSAPTRV
jgi:hypothetical protein